MAHPRPSLRESSASVETRQRVTRLDFLMFIPLMSVLKNDLVAKY